MRTEKTREHEPGRRALRHLALLLFAVIVPVTLPVQSATVWTGDTLEFERPALGSAVDELTPLVHLTRGDSAGLFNAVADPAGYRAGSPTGTAWAFGTTSDDLTALSFEPWAELFGGSGFLASRIVGVDLVVHLIDEDIFLDLRFLSWGSGPTGGGAFAYRRSTSPIGPPIDPVPIPGAALLLLSGLVWITTRVNRQQA